jgi:large subunit ribosomal protein L21
MWLFVKGFKKCEECLLQKRFWELEQVGFEMYAVIKTGGKQYKVTTNDEIYVAKIDATDGTELDMDVVAANNGSELIVDSAKLGTVSVTSKVLKSAKAKKITVFTYKPKKNQKRKMGHRQQYTKLQISAINGL